MNFYATHRRILTLVIAASLGTIAIEGARAADTAAF